MEIVRQAVPLRVDADHVVRVGSTRVPLDSVVFAFEHGATAEEIVQQFTSLELPDVYAVIAYYLRHRPTVEAYLQDRRKVAGLLREENEATFDLGGLRERLLARRNRRATL